MILLTLGVALFTLIHLYPCFAAAHRARLRERLGENRYKGLFSLLVFVAIACIIAGWRTVRPFPLYFLPDWGPLAMMGMMPISLILFFRGRAPTICAAGWFIRSCSAPCSGPLPTCWSTARRVHWCCLAVSGCGRW